MSSIHVDYSGLSQWRKCQLAWFFGYQLQLQSKGSVNPDSPLVYGSIGHDALQSWYSVETFHDDSAALAAAAKSMFQYKSKDIYQEERPEKWMALWHNLSANLLRYFVKYETEKINPLSPEQPFDIQLTPDVSVYGKLDSLIEYQGKLDTEKKIWILENKFYKTLPSDVTYLDWDLQTSTYSIVGRSMFGTRFGGVLYNFIRKSAAKTPGVQLFLRKEITRPKELLKSVVKFIVVQGRHMAWVQEKGPTYIVPVLDNSPMWDNPCVRCNYNRDLCKAFREGGDWQAIADENYEKRKEYAIADEDVDLND